MLLEIHAYLPRVDKYLSSYPVSVRIKQALFSVTAYMTADFTPYFLFMLQPSKSITASKVYSFPPQMISLLPLPSPPLPEIRTPYSPKPKPNHAPIQP